MSRNWRKIPWHLRYRTMTKLASDLRRVVILATHRHCRVEFQGPVHLGPGFQLMIPNAGEFVVGPGVDFRRGFVCEISGKGRVTIGAGSVFTSNALIQCSTSIDIGSRCAFVQSVLIVDGFHRFRDPTLHPFDQGYDYRPITIGDGVVVAAKCTIVNDIGERAIIGANSVVTKPIPAYTFAVGAPARVIEYFGPADQRPADIDA